MRPNRPVVVALAALADAAEIATWYESRQQGLGRQFQDRLTEAIDRIAAFPESYQVFRRSMRRAVLHQFPHHAVVFVVRPHRVEVLAITDTRRHPRAFLGRTLSTAS